MDTLELLDQRISGLSTRLTTLREHERLFQRAAGLRAQLEKDRAALLELEEEREKAKAELAELQGQKATAMQATAGALADKMGEVLPYGRAAFRIDDEGKDVSLSWEEPGGASYAVPYGGLSGGQRVMFESALGYALLPAGTKNPVILIEAAELGKEIAPLLERMAATNVGAQIIACTCHDVASPPEGWNLTTVARDAPRERGGA
ncbi:MAG: ATP-binding protein [Desulfovibrio sp.]|nr:ATP-binding protein [Desulfovibrio sp.]